MEEEPQIENVDREKHAVNDKQQLFDRQSGYLAEVEIGFAVQLVRPLSFNITVLF
ncbi:MAG: hypothetical protein IKN17_12630 [Ruminococcus sp.]|nr:hypothetical protein [Ruminococcus sp.]MBR6874342.1 hypothetical protein [Ruminococcus sp.]